MLARGYGHLLLPWLQRRDVLIATLRARVTLLETTLAQQWQIEQRLTATLQCLTDRLAQYESEVRHERPGASRPVAGCSKFKKCPRRRIGSYSVDTELRLRRRRRQHKKLTERMPIEVKLADAERVDEIYPPETLRSDVM